MSAPSRGARLVFQVGRAAQEVELVEQLLQSPLSLQWRARAVEGGAEGAANTPQERANRDAGPGGVAGTQGDEQAHGDASAAAGATNGAVASARGSTGAASDERGGPAVASGGGEGAEGRGAGAEAGGSAGAEGGSAAGGSAAVDSGGSAGAEGGSAAVESGVHAHVQGDAESVGEVVGTAALLDGSGERTEADPVPDGASSGSSRAPDTPGNAAEFRVCWPMQAASVGGIVPRDEKLARLLDPALAEGLLRGDPRPRLCAPLRGTLLREWVRTRPPETIGEVRDLMRPILELVQAFHDAGFALLALAPSTLAVNEEGEAHLVGVATAFRAGSVCHPPPLPQGLLAPEICMHEGQSGEATYRADLYALGALLWFLIARRTPPASALTAYRPALRARDVNPNFPIGLGPLLDRCLHLDPSQRPASPADVLADLERLATIEAEEMDLDARITVAAETHVGVGKRAHNPINQDHVLALQAGDSLSLLAVADGVSTAACGSGDVASRIAIETIQETWAELLQSPPRTEDQVADWMEDAAQRANRTLIAHVNDRYGPFPEAPRDVMGSTLIFALLIGPQAWIASLGDSRAYLLRGGQLERITRDHNLRLGALLGGTPVDLALTHPQGDALTNCLGLYVQEDSDVLVAETVRVDIFCVPMHPGDRLLLCSDGLTDFSGDTEEEGENHIAALLATEPRPDLACLELMLHANREGGGDNIGVVLAAVDAAGRSQGPWYS